MKTLSQIKDTYLKNSVLYEELVEDGDDSQFDVISEHETDIYKILHTIRYWGLYFIPDKFLDVIINTDNLEVICDEFFTEEEIDLKNKILCNDINNSAEFGYLDFLMFFHKKHPFLYKETCLDEEEDYFECLTYDSKIKDDWVEEICPIAAYNGHLDCLKYLHENGFPWDEETCLQASYGGSLECLKYAHENGCPWNIESYQHAAKNGHLECLKYLNENNCPRDDYICCYAIESGHLDCLKYLHENGFHFNDLIFMVTVLCPNPECIKYVRENTQSF